MFEEREMDIRSTWRRALRIVRTPRYILVLIAVVTGIVVVTPSPEAQEDLG